MKDFGCPLFTLTSFFLEKDKTLLLLKIEEREILLQFERTPASASGLFSKASAACNFLEKDEALLILKIDKNEREILLQF